LVEAAIDQCIRGVSTTPRDAQEESRSDISSQNIHPDRVFQLRNTVPDNIVPPPSNPSNSNYQCIDRQAKEPSQDIGDLDLDSSEPDQQL